MNKLLLINKMIKNNLLIFISLSIIPIYTHSRPLFAENPISHEIIRV